MSARVVSFVFDGDTFVGHFTTSGGAGDTLVKVRYKGTEISANCGRLPEEAVAKTLLGELVRDDLISTAPKTSPSEPRVRPASPTMAPASPRLRRRLNLGERLARSTGRESPPTLGERLR